MTRALRIAVAIVAASFTALPLHAQQLGNKLLGSTGIDAGVQSPAGIFLIDQSLRYGANKLRDRDGNTVPIDGLSIHAIGTALGVAYTLLTSHGQYIGGAIGIPVAKISINSDEPGASLNGRGFGDVLIQPLKVGWRVRQFDIVSSYALYVPSGKFEPRGGSVGRGYWTHELSLGGAMYFDSTRASRMSVLASYDRNSQTREIQLHRGNMFQLQGGAGIGVTKIAVVGVAGYALWQATRDRGADIPPKLQGQWSRVFALGPEIDVLIPMLRMHAEVRYEREFGVTSRSQGDVLSVGLAYGLSRPRQKPPKQT